jgi:hypothetical protein
LFVLYTSANSRKTHCCCAAVWLIKGWKLECRGSRILLGLTVIYILRIEVFVEMKMWHLVVCPVVHTSIFGTCCHHLQDRILTKLGQDKEGDQVRERTGGSACLETEMERRWDPRRVWGWKGLEWINVVSHWSTEPFVCFFVWDSLMCYWKWDYEFLVIRNQSF